MRWLGYEPGQAVDPDEGQVLLSGRHPVTGERIISAGSHGCCHLRTGQPTLAAGFSQALEDLWNARDGSALLGLPLYRH